VVPTRRQRRRGGDDESEGGEAEGEPGVPLFHLPLMFDNIGGVNSFGPSPERRSKVGAVRRLLPLLFLATAGCSVVKAYHVADDWKQQDQRKVKRLAVVVSPLPDGKQVVGEAAARIARRYVNMKRDFIVKAEVVEPQRPPLEKVCGGDDNIEGVLFLSLGVTPKGNGVELQLDGALARCGDGREDWTVRAAGSFPSKDEGLKEVTAIYVQELGGEVEPYVPPFLNLLRPALDTLPQPLLTDEDRDEKIVNGD